MILWFRPEIEQTIRWAGEPTKPSAVDGRLHPRRSFASWQEFVRGRSLRWSASAEAALLELRQALLGIVLRRAQERAEVAIELTRVNQELEAFSYTVSHDLRAPMRHIAGYADLVLDTEDKVLSERARRYLGQVKEASAYAGQLVDALLDFSRMGRSALKRSTVPTEMLVDDLVRELAGIETGRPIEWTIERPLRTCTETRSCCRSRSATCSATRSSSRAAAKGTGIGLANVRRIEARLIDDLLDLTAISAGKVSMKRTSVDMHALVRTVAEMVEHDARAKRHRVVLDLSAATPCVEADEARMQQVLWNLVRNAIKFTPNGGEIRITTRSDTAGFVLTCSDSGIGIDAESLPRIFSAFEQAGDEISQRYGGLGLGLAIAKGLVDQMHGSLAAASPGTGQGSTFTLRMPIGTARPGDCAAAEGSAAVATTHATAAAQACRLLLVEDNIDAAEAMALSLEACGYDVTHAKTKAQALALAERSRFDIVLTDLGLPDGSGIDVGRALSGSVPVVALSGYGTPQDVREFTTAGFSGHLVKPVDPIVVCTTIEKILAERSQA